MIRSRTIILLLVTAAVVAAWSLPCRAEQKQKDEESIWTEEEPRGPGRGPRRGRGPARFELTDEEIDRIMSSLKKSSPEKAKELAELRKENPEKFQAELRKYGREEFGKIIKGRIERWRRERQNEFLEWLGKNVPKEAEELAKLKEKDPSTYAKKYELTWRKYGRIYDRARRSPELAEVLLADLQLQERREELLSKIKAAKSEGEKKKLIAELEEVVSQRYDLIVRQKQIAYERLLKWLEELRNRIRESRDEIIKSQDEKFKAENVKKRIRDLTGESNPQFRWD